MLAPVIQELRQLRQQHEELETNYNEKKRIYDAALAGLDSEVNTLDQQVKLFQQDIQNDQTRYHYLNSMMRLLDISQDRVMGEMKAYIGGDEMVELIQKTRGFKTYRDLYSKKILELEHHSKVLKEKQREVKEKHDHNMKQVDMFNSIKKMLILKQRHNHQVLNGQPEENVIVTQDRLVLT